MEPLKIGITGVRGVVGQTLTPELVVRFAEALGSYLDGDRVLVCRDPRPSGPMVQAAVTAGLLSVGCEVVDLGICPTPTLQLAVGWLGAKGGVSITGGHNPPEWNALKFVRGDGLYLSAIQGEELLDVFHQGAVERAGWDRLATRVEEKDAIPHHLEALVPRFDVAAIRARRLRVAVDCGNGSCSRLVPQWLAELGCEVTTEVESVLRLQPRLAPVKAAVFPLLRKDGQPEKAHEIHALLCRHFPVQYDQAGSIGRRYRRQDEIGTPFGITVDHETMRDNTVTLRDRDTMQQERLPVDRLVDELKRRIEV